MATPFDVNFVTRLVFTGNGKVAMFMGLGSETEIRASL